MSDPLPFDLNGFVVSLESFKWGLYDIPKYGSLTVSEQIQLASIPAEDKNVGQYCAAMAVIILRRINIEATAEQLEAVPIHYLEELYEFVKNESRQWREKEPDDNSEKKSILTGQLSTGSSDLPIQESDGLSENSLAIVLSG